MSATRRIATGLVAVLGAWLLYLAALWLSRSGDVRLYHLQTATVWLVAAGLVRGLMARGQRSQKRTTGPGAFLVAWPVFVCASLLIFWPAVGVGFLSDDHVLFARAANLELGAVSPEFLRPVPMAVWALFAKLGSGAPGLHLLGLVLHGTNAYLAARVSARWFERRFSHWLVGALFLLSPLSPEAVVWASGIFDVLMTSIVLVTLLVARRYRSSTDARARAVLVALVVLALATKESAVGLAGLLVLDAWATGQPNPWKPRFDWVASALLAAGYGLFRLSTALTPEDVAGFGRYEIQRAVFASFGAFALPWRQAEFARVWLPFATVCVVVVLVTTGMMFWDRARMRIPAAAAAWVFVAIVPVVPILVVGPDLEASRYLYLASVGWATLIAALAEALPRPSAVAGAVVGVVVLAGLYAVGVREHVNSWTRAASLRDAVVSAATTSRVLSGCAAITVVGLPDSIEGAYVFRNGAVEALGAKGIRLIADAPPTCTLTWDPNSRSFR